VSKQTKQGEKMDLHGKVMIITGASSGIGAATARRLNEKGMKFVLTARSEDKLAALSEDLDDSMYVVGDMVEPEMPVKLLEGALQRYGSVDVVFNNAGIMHLGGVDEVDIDDLCHMVRLNVEAVVRMSYVMVRHMKAQGGGFLINTSSLAGIKTFPLIGPYNGTKFAVEALTDSLRMELAGSGVKVAAIEPGRTKTELFSHWPEEKRFRPEDGLIEAGDIARCIEFILEQPDDVLIPRLLVVPTIQER
jgi:NADP-dependent 3-hydroxy acid dehydrogenase YdfG